MKQTLPSQLNNKAILWAEHHLESLTTSFNRYRSNPISYGFTVAMIAIALSIPMGIYIFFSSAQQLTQQWDGDKQITIFLNDDITLSQAQSLAKELKNTANVLDTRVLDKQQALTDFKQQMGLNSLSSDLPDNPLPHLIIIDPQLALSDINSLKELEAELNNTPQVQLVQFDLIWFQRLQAILDMVKQIQWLVSIVLLLAIALIIANVIRWEVSARHSEIEIIKLVGASDAYVRRPFLYSGLWLGIGGSLLAILIVSISTWLVRLKTDQLALLFDSEFKLSSLSVSLCMLIVAFISIVGIAASWVAVTHKLKHYC